MSNTFNSDPSDQAANSFVSVIEADTYFNNLYSKDKWPSSNEIKERLLVTASQRINEETFTSTKTDEGRELQFPALGISDRWGNTIPSTDVPSSIKIATYEQAYYYLSTRILSDEELESAKNFANTSESIDGISSSYTFGNIKTDKLSLATQKNLIYLNGLWLASSKAIRSGLLSL